MSVPHEVIDVTPIAVDYVEHSRPLVRGGLIAIAAVITAFAAWAVLAPLSGAAIAPGVVKVDMNRKTVQHQEGGIVGAILVRDGSRVRAGESLLVLQDVRVDSSRELAQTQLDAGLAKAARLSAEQSWASSIAFPEELLARASDTRIAELFARETALFKARRDAYNSVLALINSQMAEARAEIRAREGQLAADNAAAGLQREQLSANEALLLQGFVAKTRLLDLQRSVAETQGRIGESEAERSRALQKVTDLQLRAQELRNKMMQDASAELRETTAQVFDLRDRLRPTQDAETRQRLLAPISGEVVDLKVTTVGAVIGPREPILDIVPENAELIVEARVKPEDINSVRAGAPADVRLTAFRQRTTPTVSGRVKYVSADSLVDKVDKSAFYVVHVLVSPEALKEAGGLTLQAGMPAEVFIQTSARTALEYLLDPITAFLQRSMREH